MDQEMYSGVQTGSGTSGMVLVVMEKRWELCQSEENNLRNDGLVSLTSVHRNVIVWIFTKAVSSSISRHRKGGNLIGNSHTDLSRSSLTGFSDEMSSTGWEERWRCPCQGKGKPWAAGAAQTPLCQRFRAAAAAHEALVALESLHCKETTQGNKKPGDFQVTHGSHLCSSESAKSTRIKWFFEDCKAVFWSVVLLDTLRSL